MFARSESQRMITGRARCVRPLLEPLEDRTAPAVWTNAGGDFLWSNPANWSTGAVPADGDYVQFQEYQGTDDGCLFDLPSATLDRVWINADYDGVLTIAGGATLAIDNYFELGPNAGLALDAGGVLEADALYLGGSVTALVGSANVPARLTARGSLFLQQTGAITVNGGPLLPGNLPGLVITSGGFDSGGSITIGTELPGIGMLPAILTIAGPFVQLPHTTMTVNLGSVVNFNSGGMEAAYPHIQGTIELFGSTINTDTKLSLEGGTQGGKLNSHGAPDGTADTIGTIAGIGGNIVNEGTINWLGAFHALEIAGTYTTPSSAMPGTLRMRIAAGGLSDFLNVAGGAWNVRINLEAVDAVAAGDAWTLVTAPMIEVYAITFPADLAGRFDLIGGTLVVFS